MIYDPPRGRRYRVFADFERMPVASRTQHGIPPAPQSRRLADLADALVDVLGAPQDAAAAPRSRQSDCMAASDGALNRVAPAVIP